MQYMQDGQLGAANSASITVNRSMTMDVAGKTVSASQVSIDYPFSFIVLQPVARLVSPTTSVGNAVVMHAQSLMRNESQ
jgi:hypothetical protein